VSTWETVLIDGVDIFTVAQNIQVWEGIHDVAAQRGDPIPIPGADGAVDPGELPFGVGVLPLGLQLRGSSLTGFNDAHRALKRMCKVGRQVTLSRRLSYTTGNETHTAAGRYLSGLAPTLFTPALGKVLLSFSILDGKWHGPAVTIGAGTSSITGDVRTRRMLVTVSAGTSPVVTNTTNGSTFTISGSTSTPVVVDVEALSASASGVDCSGRLSWNTGSFDYPLQLEPGSNTLTISSGTLSVAYQPAYE
jgi:hypothetical protein